MNIGQGAAALIGITLGLIPLIGIGAGRGPGLWRVVFGNPAEVRWWMPTLVVVVCVIIIAALERSARR